MARCTLIVGGSWSLRRARLDGRLSRGGGERRRGDTGHWFSRTCSGLTGAFWGAGALAPASWDAGRRVGVVAALRVLDPVGGMGMLDRDTRTGLDSWTLFFRDLVPGPLFLNELPRGGGRIGDGSRELKGDCDVELVADESLED